MTIKSAKVYLQGSNDPIGVTAPDNIPFKAMQSADWLSFAVENGNSHEVFWGVPRDSVRFFETEPNRDAIPENTGRITLPSGAQISVSIGKAYEIGEKSVTSHDCAE